MLVSPILHWNQAGAASQISAQGLISLKMFLYNSDLIDIIFCCSSLQTLQIIYTCTYTFCTAVMIYAKFYSDHTDIIWLEQNGISLKLELWGNLESHSSNYLHCQSIKSCIQGVSAEIKTSAQYWFTRARVMCHSCMSDVSLMHEWCFTCAWVILSLWQIRGLSH